MGRHWKMYGVSLLICSIVGIGLALSQNAQSQSTDSDLAMIIDALKHSEQLVTSGRGVATIETRASMDPDLLAILPDDQKPKLEKTVDQFTWKFDHNKYYEESVTITPDPPDSKAIYGYDGSEGYYYQPRDQYYMKVTPYSRALGLKLEDTPAGSPMVAVWLGLSHNYGHALPDANGYYGDPPLSQVLVSKGAFYIGEESADGVACKRLDSVRNSSLSDGTISESWWIAPEKGFALLKHAISWVNSSKGTRTRWVTTTREAKTYEGNIVLPQRVEKVCTMTLPSGKELIALTKTFIVESLEVNPVFAPDAFKFPPPPGARVFEDRPEE